MSYLPLVKGGLYVRSNAVIAWEGVTKAYIKK